VPHGHEMIFATGFAHFFAGDFLVAAHLLVPQVEGALRHMLRQVGHDVTNMRTDGTQESRSLSNLLDPKGLRRELEAMFGPAIVREVDDLFDFHGGPALRHGLAHGLMSDGAFWNEDVIYACWFVFRLVVLALLPCRQEVERSFPR
ncbi:MAG: hypothetical protein KDG89_16840, partial [Geminicoccaceae bacterium]|nr:hypothetical protein [Geminicoccaceae bacterium]